jgi:hypothetical protein
VKKQGGNIMDQKKIFKQIIEFNKTTFNNSYDTLVMLNNQAEKIKDTFYSANPILMPEESKNIISEWTEAVKKGCDEFKETVNKGFNKLEEYLI